VNARRCQPRRTLAALALAIAASASAEPGYPWLRDGTPSESLAERVAPPPGYRRTAAADGSFAAWLRGMPLREAGSPVRLHDGSAKRYQAGAFAVVDLDVGARDLQQCADAVIRLRAEYLRAAGCAERVAFDFTSGHPARWSDWSAGQRPVVSGSRVSWERRAAADSSYASFRRYLDAVFTYAGSLSLARELQPVADPADVRAGDVFIQGGSPGHAVLVADTAKDAQGRTAFLLLQSYMPAQDVHLLQNLTDAADPWYTARRQAGSRRPSGASRGRTCGASRSRTAPRRVRIERPIGRTECATSKTRAGWS
jgi:hypothetical protein